MWFGTGIALTAGFAAMFRKNLRSGRLVWILLGLIFPLVLALASILVERFSEAAP